jgi:CubicO group peptidase (beta-lactamase class C family)
MSNPLILPQSYSHFSRFFCQLSAAFFALCLSLVSLRAAEPFNISEIVEANLAEYRVPGAVVAVIEDGKVTHLQGYGVRNVESKDPVDADTIFQLASVTKTLAAATYAAAVDAGAIEWEQPVRAVFPEFRLHCPYATQWTNGVDLLVHRTGLPPFVGALYESLGFSHQEILERIPLIVPSTSFRERAQYSNIGYFLAGEAAAAAMKTTWPELLQTKIFDPLQMNRSIISSQPKADEPNVALPYVLTPENTWREARPDTQPVLLPAGGVSSTGRDLSRYLTMLLAGGTFAGRTVLKPESVEEMFRPIIAEEPGFAELPPIGISTGFSYTPGWAVYYYNGQRILEKGGALAGFRTLLLLMPDMNYGVAILSNLNFTVFPEAVRAALLEQKLGSIPGRNLAQEIRAHWEKLGELTSPPPPTKNPTPAKFPLAAYTGTYSSLTYGTWQILEDEGRLVVRAGPAGFHGDLGHDTEETFLCRWNSENSGVEALEFQNNDGAVTGFLFDNEVQFTKH